MKYTPRIFSLVWASLAMATAGSGYMFSLYGPQLKASKGMSQFQISFVATCTNSGLFLTGPLFGYLVDRYYKHSHFLFLIAASLIALGYILTALEFAGVLPHTHYLITSLYFLLIGVGSSACYHKSLSTNIRNWPAQYRGLAIGVPVSAFGLSAFIFSKIASLFFYNQDHADHDRPILNVTLLLLFVGITGFVVNLAMVFLLKDLSSAAAGGAVVLERSSEELDSTSPLVDSSVGEEEVGEEGEVPGSGEQEGLVRGGGNHDQSFSNHQQQQQEVDISCFNQLDAYLLGLVMLSICGIGLMQTNNIGFILVSLFPESVTASDPAVQAAQNLHVSVISTCNFAGRLLCGFFSDFFFKKRRLFCNFSAPRIIWPLFASIFMLLGSIVGGVFVGGESVDDNLGLLFYVSVFL